MTQKANLFKGKAKKKSIPPNRHGKAPVTRKGFTLSHIVFLPFQCTIFCNNLLPFLSAGKRFVKPSKVTKEMDADRVSPFNSSLIPTHFIPLWCS